MSDVCPVIQLTFPGTEIGCWVGLLKPRGCSVDFKQDNGMLLTSDTSEVQGATKLDYSDMGLKGGYSNV